MRTKSSKELMLSIPNQSFDKLKEIQTSRIKESGNNFTIQDLLREIISNYLK